MFQNRYRTLFATLVFLLAGAATVASAEIPWQRSPEAALKNARQNGRPILVFVSAKWCHYCTKMKRETWSDPGVQAAVNGNFETLVLDGEKDEAVVNKLGLRGFPATLVYTPEGEFVQQAGGFMPPGKTLAWLGALRR